MKFVLSIVLTLLAFSGFSQDSLFVSISPYDVYNDLDFHIYKDDSLIYTNCVYDNYAPDFLYQLKKGKYKIMYFSLIGKDSVEVDFKSNNERKNITLYPIRVTNSYLKNTSSYIQQLKINEKIKIEYSVSGCFKSKNSAWEVIRKKKDYFVRINKKWKPMSPQNLKKLIRYEKIMKSSYFQGEDIDGGFMFSTGSTTFQLIKKNKIIFKIRTFKDWSHSKDLETYFK